MIRVLLVDDQALVRSGFRIILDSEEDIEVVGEAADGAEAVRLAADLEPDVICMDVEMPVMDGIAASRRILGDPSRSGSAPAVLVLTTFGHETYLFDALQAGVSGFLLKTSQAEQLIDAVRTLASGQALLGPDVTRAVIERVTSGRASSATAVGALPAGALPTGAAAAGAAETRSSEADGPPIGGSEPDPALAAAGLTDRESQVLRLLAQGRSNGEIAAELFVGDATVKTHVSNLLQKLGVRDRIQAVVWAHTHHAV